MKPASIIQEILFVTTSSFAGRELCEGDSQDKNNPYARAEQLEAACWNGMLDELLPEINQHSPETRKLFLWEVELRKTYLMISRGEYPPVPECNFTIDPQLFLYTRQMN
jgi:hypothetical protein